ncbi:MAG: hypothetical protein QHH12_02585 [Candidatus Bathyarchaeota archaeon]|jgi:hypothetical protein|nr:hypothetical protein [Candidatus Bathyarchaeota archaeon]
MDYSREVEVNLLWSGGWDSTFRLLYLVFVEKKCVQPFYIVDTERASTMNEFKVMRIVREEVAKRDPRLAELIKPAMIVLVHDIKLDPDITSKFNRLSKRLPAPLGPQYEWFARFAKQWNIQGLELCIEFSERAPNTLVNLLSKYICDDSRMKGFDENDDVSFFSFFSFPLLRLSKNGMKRIAREKGFLDILEKTWFCQRPWLNRPCGICGSCDIAIKEGFSYRIPRISRLRHFMCTNITSKITRYFRKKRVS